MKEISSIEKFQGLQDKEEPEKVKFVAYIRSAEKILEMESVSNAGVFPFIKIILNDFEKRLTERGEEANKFGEFKNKIEDLKKEFLEIEEYIRENGDNAGNEIKEETNAKIKNLLQKIEVELLGRNTQEK